MSPDGKYLYVANRSDNTVSVISTIAFSIEQTYDVGTDPRDCAVSPNGRYVLTANYNGGTVTIIDLGGPAGGDDEETDPGQGGSGHNLGLVVAHTGEKAGQSGQAVSREFVLPGILFEQTWPAGATEQCWVALNESGTRPSGVTYAMEVGYNSGAMVAGFNTIWPQSLLQGMSSGTHHLVYHLMTADGRMSNYRDEYLVLGG